MKRAIVILWAGVMAVNAWAASEIVDGVTWNYTVSNGKASVYKGSSSPAIPTLTKGALTIPATLGGYPVTSIGSSAFSGCSGLTSVTIPSSVTSIGEFAFRGCSGLMLVTIPSSVTNIGGGAFYNCSGLMSVTIPSSVTSFGCSRISMGLGSTEVGVFSECTALMFVLLNDGLRIIGNCMFSGCSKLTSVTIPSSVTSIGDYAFYGCSGLTSVTLPEGVASIGYSAFSGCSGLTSVTIPEGVTSIGSSAFGGCSGLTSVTIPEGVTSIGSSAFYGCSGLRSVEFLGPPPRGLSDSYLLKYGRASYPREYGKDWLKFRGINSFTGYGQGEKPVVEVVSAAIREDNPTVMDVVYKVVSAKPTVKVRTLAFQDGERSFAKVVRPTEFIEDTAKNIGDAITANEEHKLSWRVSTDWKVDLAKVKFEVLASEDDLLPLELTTIPKIGDNAAMEISWNAITEQQVFDALLWLYADEDAGLTLNDGVLKRTSDGYLLGYGTTVSIWNGRYSKNVTGNGSAYYYFALAIDYVYSKMGFSVLSGDELKYANEMTRFGLSPSGVRQYAWRAVEE